MKGKVAIITASSTGIGRAMALELAQEGVKVIISSRNAENVQSTVSQFQGMGHDVHGIVCHVGNKEDRERLISQTMDKYGRIDFLVPNAATNLITKGFLETTESQIQKMFDINYKSTFSLIQAALPYLKRQNGSSILVIGTLGAYDPFPDSGHYSITKLASIAMVKVISGLLQDSGIRVNCLNPGLIKTQFSKVFWEDENVQKKFIQSMKIKRLGMPHEIAKVAKFLLSDEASYITGQAVTVAGRPSSRL